MCDSVARCEHSPCVVVCIATQTRLLFHGSARETGAISCASSCAGQVAKGFVLCEVECAPGAGALVTRGTVLARTTCFRGCRAEAQALAARSEVQTELFFAGDCARLDDPACLSRMVVRAGRSVKMQVCISRCIRRALLSFFQLAHSHVHVHSHQVRLQRVAAWMPGKAHAALSRT